MSIRKQPESAKGAKRLSWKANLLFAAVVLAAAVLLVFLLRPRSKTEPLAAVVDFGDGITEVLPLDKDYDYLYDVGSYVVHLQVKDGTISFQDSQCPDHVCEQFGQLSEEGAWAACVPAGVYVQLAPLKGSRIKIVIKKRDTRIALKRALRVSLSGRHKNGREIL